MEQHGYALFTDILTHLKNKYPLKNKQEPRRSDKYTSQISGIYIFYALLKMVGFILLYSIITKLLLWI